MAASSSGIIRFIVHVEHGLLLELGDTGASASLAARFHAEVGADPDYETTAVAGMTFDLGDGERGLCISRSPNAEAANEATSLITRKYGLVRRLNRPPYRTGSPQGTTSGIDWVQDCERFRYDI